MQGELQLVLVNCVCQAAYGLLEQVSLKTLEEVPVGNRPSFKFCAETRQQVEIEHVTCTKLWTFGGSRVTVMGCIIITG
jgi:hypothetical protein